MKSNETFLKFSVIHLLEIGSTTSFPSFTHKIGISEIGLSQGGSVNNRLLAFVDKNRDLFVMVMNLRIGSTASRKIEKLGRCAD